MLNEFNTTSMTESEYPIPDPHDMNESPVNTPADPPSLKTWEDHNIKDTDFMLNDSEPTILKCRANRPADMSHEVFMSLMRQYVHTPLHQFEERERLQKLLGFKDEPCDVDPKLRALCLKEVEELNKRELRKLRKMDRDRKRDEEHAEFIRLTKLNKAGPGII